MTRPYVYIGDALFCDPYKKEKGKYHEKLFWSTGIFLSDTCHHFFLETLYEYKYPDEYQTSFQKKLAYKTTNKCTFQNGSISSYKPNHHLQPCSTQWTLKALSFLVSSAHLSLSRTHKKLMHENQILKRPNASLWST